MTLEQLRLKHPRLLYKQYSMGHDNGELTITYDFLLEPDIVFRSHVSLPYFNRPDFTKIAPYVFELGIIEAISYWKAVCPSEFVIEAGVFSKEQERFWYELFIHGLGEFFYRNDIDFTEPNFLSIHNGKVNRTSGVEKDWKNSIPYQQINTITYPVAADILLVGGGKDSAVSLEVLSQSNRTIIPCVLNPSAAALSLIETAGMSRPIVVKRTIDPTLLTLNESGYLNGHTPFSAYLAFLGVLVGALYDSEHVIASNEKSADEGNVVYRGMEVNHQYSKSFRFEQAFRAYAQQTFENAPVYFSLLRPFNDLQIATLFSHAPRFFHDFRSCNVGSRSNIWCGKCPKCAFTYLILFPFLTIDEMETIFGRDYFQDEIIISYIRELVGLVPVKPFECVGTRDEAKLAVVLSFEKYQTLHNEIPEGLFRVKTDLGLSKDDITGLKKNVMHEWGDVYNVPPAYMSILADVWNRRNGE